MFDALRHWLPRPTRDSMPALLQRWALAHGMSYRVVKEPGGCVLHAPEHDWRIEWGPSQRSYIPGSELRLMADVQHPQDLVLLLLNRRLAEAMERVVYERYVETVQTRADTDTPVEMRWLVMCERLAPQDLKTLGLGWVMVCSQPAWARQWLARDLQPAWQALIDAQVDDEPLTLSVGRGRLVLRTAMPSASPARLDDLSQAYTGCLQALRRMG